MHEILQSILDEKRTVKKSKGENWEAKDMMDLLMEVRDEDGEGFDDETITEMIFSMLFGGQETSAFTSMWAVLFLTDNPHIFQKAKVRLFSNFLTYMFKLLHNNVYEI